VTAVRLPHNQPLNVGPLAVMRTRRPIFVGLALATVAVAASYVLLRDRYRPGVEAALRGDLRQVNFRPHVDRAWVSVTDPAESSAIREAVLGARSLSVASRPPASCDLQFVFADGRVVDTRMSPTGMTARNFIREDPASFKPLGYVILEWNGHQRGMDAKPFNDALRRRNRVAATQPAGPADAR
jgi:hypothetical protein